MNRGKWKGKLCCLYYHLKIKEIILKIQQKDEQNEQIFLNRQKVGDGQQTYKVVQELEHW